MNRVLENQILVISDVEGSSRSLRRVAASMPSVAPLAFIASSEVAKLKYRFREGVRPLGIVVVAGENSEGHSMNSGTSESRPALRSLEGVVCELSEAFSRSVFNRMIVFTKQLNRLELRFLAEFAIKKVKLSHDVQAPSDETCRALLGDLCKSIEQHPPLDDGSCPLDAEAMVGKLNTWDTLEDSEKRALENSLRAYLGPELSNSILNLRENKTASPKYSFLIEISKELNRQESHFNALNLLAVTRMHLGLVSEAIQTHLRLNAYSPRNPLRHTRLGRCYLRINRVELAERSFLEALKFDHQQKDARLELCRIKLDQHDLPSVQRWISETDDPSILCKFYNAMGIAKTRELRMDEAISWYLRAFDATVRQDEQLKVLVNIGIAYAKWGKFTEAKYFAGLALAMAPSSEKIARLNSLLVARDTSSDRQDMTHDV